MGEIYLLAIVLSLAALFAVVVKRFKQPLLVSYIAIGAILSATHLIKPEQLQFLSILPDIGLAFLLFLVGMELDLREFKSLGRNILLATISQVVMTSVIVGSLLAVAGWTFKESLLIALLVSFSSTILVVKLLSEGKEISSLQGKLSIGILLIEDLIAVVLLMLMMVASGSNGSIFNPILLGVVAFKGILLILLSLLAGKKILPKVIDYSADNSELVFLVSISWCLLFVSFSVYLGFSLAIGAFLAGVSLAQSVYRNQITSRVRPLRDFFIMIFFLDLGTGLSISGISQLLWLAVFFLFYTVVLKPVIFFLIFTAFNFRAHSAFKTSIFLSSISEFSLIALTLAIKLKLVDGRILSPLIFATVISFIFSSVLINQSHRLYPKLKSLLRRFEDEKATRFDFKSDSDGVSGHAILIGCHRSGRLILNSLVKIFGNNLLVLDFNPEVISRLRQESVKCLYGDISDSDIQDELKLKEAKLVVSTVRDLPDNLSLLEGIKRAESPAYSIFTASDQQEALRLYEAGADYVSLPMFLEGNSISKLIKETKGSFTELKKEREERIEELRRMTQ